MKPRVLPEVFSQLVQVHSMVENGVLPTSLDVEVDAFESELRTWRNQEMALIASDDIAMKANVPDTLLAVTSVAEKATQAAVELHLSKLQQRYGVCCKPDGEEVSFTVLGMGKLGGRELNFSSDIDLICLYDAPGVCDGSGRLSAEEFYTKLVKAVTKSLNSITAEGFVFRVDLRLRPYGGAGPLAMHFDQAEAYYEMHGRDWERYAFIKARPVAGDIAAGEAFLERLKPFIYRRYLDFTALHGLRDLKAKIEKQYAQKRLDDNIKLGPGGIREIEFIAQSFQLVRGGHCEELQTQSLYKALAAAEQLGFLDQKAYAALLEAYEFLRMVENRLQQRRDQQVHHLPESEAEQELLSGVLGVDDYGAFLAVLDAQRAVVREQFQQVLVTDSSEESAVSREVGEAFSGLKNSAAYEQLSERAQGYIAQIMSHLSRSDFSADALDFLVRLVEQVLKRSTYLAWLAEQPAALQRLLFFATRSSWMAEQVLQQPALMDELVDDRALQSLPNAEQKSALLLQQLSRVPSDDLEQAMDVCRRFKASQQFLIAAADVAGYLPVMQVSDHLSELAEVILQQSLDWVAAELQQRTGRPQLLLEGQSRDAQMVVIGYGKLGGLELGYGSDLDIVLLHDGNGKALGTNGDKALENAVYFQRLGQRFVHFLSANTPSGRLYEIDTRLRPSGNSGLLVTSLQSYENYQRESAWTWEHQALVRARAVAGPQALKTQFEEVRLALLCLKRDPAELKRDVVEMREKMREHLDDSDNEHTNLKQGPGGFVDIEFICQYLVLRYASESCGLFEITDNARQLQRLVAAGALEARQADELTAAYLAIRGATHHQRLGCPAPQLDMPLSNYREQVVGIWLELLE